ncbi:MAG TPA: response regulator [Methylomirabilota bacterium]|jgi:CheY-like chemotaxis protein|nr:response regulator [Methylomirabilota bacterium]
MPVVIAPSRCEALPDRRPRRQPPRGGDGLPHRPSDFRFRQPGDAPPPDAGVLPRILTGLHVLVVDDDQDVLDVFTMALTTCGARVTAVDNASDALAITRAAHPDVIVSDIAMVGEDGYWLVRSLRQLSADGRPRIPVIAATAYGQEHSRSRVLAAGFTEHLQKPVDPEALCRLVAKLAGR